MLWMLTGYTHIMWRTLQRCYKYSDRFQSDFFLECHMTISYQWCLW